MVGKLFAGALALALGAAGGAVNFNYEYLPPRSEELAGMHARVVEFDLLRKLPEIHALDGLLVLPAPITYIAAECGQPDAFYLPDKREVVFCYEMLRVLYEQGEHLAASNGLDGEAATAFAQRYVWANTRFILSHATGHALIDLLDLPVTGRQEDAVDQFAASLLQRFAGDDESAQQVAENLRMAGNWFLARSQDGEFSLDAYADTHSLGLQRYFNLQCLLYGSDPARFVDIVTRGDLPESRARYCPEEASRAARSWLRLLVPHVAPRFEMTEEKAERYFDQRKRDRERRGDAPYVR